MPQLTFLSMAKTLVDYAKYEFPFATRDKQYTNCQEYYKGIEDACDFIKNGLYDMKSVDAVPVVRCRECVYYGYDAYSDGVCNLSEGLPFPEDDSYCSFGLRQKGGIDNG